MNIPFLFTPNHADPAIRMLRRLGALWLLGVLLALLMTGNTARAAAPAGTVVGNQASASYSDASQVTRTVTSNTVATTVLQVAAVAFTPNGAKTVTPGGQVYYPHTITNNGNGADSFALAAAQSGSFGFTTLQFHADANGDGIPDNATAITSTGAIPAGGSVHVVLAGTVPATAVAGNTVTATLSATSAFNAGIAATASDVATVTAQGVVQVTQAMDVTTGPSPSSGRTITLTYTNTGNTAVGALVLTSTLPSGFSYVANSGRWSATGAGVVLTDAGALDVQGGIVYDQGVTAAGRVTATIATVAPGVSGTLSFRVDVNPGLAPGASAATTAPATYAYHDGSVSVPVGAVNPAVYTVTQVGALSVGGATVVAVPQGGTVGFTDVVTNTGNGTDTFTLAIGASTFPAGTSFALYRADGVTPLTGTSASGVPDTGPLAAGASVNVVVKATLPPGATGGPYSVQLIGTSRFDATRTASALNGLTAITGNIVDLSNDTAMAGATGVGAGPEAAALLTSTANPGTTLRYPLLVSNGSSVADAFELAVATDAAMVAGLPAGWTLVFRDASGATITTTGVIVPGASKAVFADLSLPPTAPAGTTSLYFRALSAATGAGDRLHDAVTVNTLRSLVVTPNGSGQTTAGGIVVYSHTLTNTGNVAEGVAAATALVATLDSLAGFSSVVYWDRNHNGQLDIGDPVLTNLSTLVGGSNGASTAAGLSPGESAVLLVKVTAPASAQPGLANVTTLTVTVSGMINGLVAPAPAISTDHTSVVGSPLQIVKTQALDADCDGIADSAFSAAPISGALPGACIRYLLTATNGGGQPITGLVVSDSTPAHTSYHAGVGAATTIGTVSAPLAGAIGTVQATVGTLAAGQSVSLSFGVRLAP